MSVAVACWADLSQQSGTANYVWIRSIYSIMTQLLLRTATCPVKRDGEMVIIPVAELVPGDVNLGVAELQSESLQGSIMM